MMQNYSRSASRTARNPALSRHANIVAARVAYREAQASNLPGLVNGPADAYRHMVWVGEMTRRFGPEIAWGVAEANEVWGKVRSRSGDSSSTERKESFRNERSMDRQNNRIGLEIGMQARTFDDVVRMARQRMDRSPEDGSGGEGGAVWLARDRWAITPRRRNSAPIGPPRHATLSTNTDMAARNSAHRSSAASSEAGRMSSWSDSPGWSAKQPAQAAVRSRSAPISAWVIRCAPMRAPLPQGDRAAEAPLAAYAPASAGTITRPCSSTRTGTASRLSP